MKEENLIKVIFGGYMTTIIVVAQMNGVDGVIATASLALLASLAGIKAVNKILKRWTG